MDFWRIFEGNRKRALRRITAAKWFPVDTERMREFDDVQLEAISAALKIVPDDELAHGLFTAASPVFMGEGFDTTRLCKKQWEELATELRGQIYTRILEAATGLERRISLTLPGTPSEHDFGLKKIKFVACVDCAALRKAMVDGIIKGESVEEVEKRLEGEATRPPYPFRQYLAEPDIKPFHEQPIDMARLRSGGNSDQGMLASADPRYRRRR